MDGGLFPLLCAPLQTWLLPDRPLDGTGSCSDWMGSAGDFSREAAPTCSHAQLSTHSAAGSARGSSIPDLRLVPAPIRPVSAKLPTRCAPRTLPPSLSQSVAGASLPRCDRRSVRTRRGDQRFLSTKTLLGASSSFCFIAQFPDILRQPPEGGGGR